MTLSLLMKKGGLSSVMTATPATVAALEPDKTATVATVAVAEPPETQSKRGKKVPVSALSEDEESAIHTWLAHIEETDPTEIAEVLTRCAADAAARAYVLERAREVPASQALLDDRRRCRQCRNLAPSGRCLAAWRGEITASRTYHPLNNVLYRCEGYAPKGDDPDQRLGCERWPNLNLGQAIMVTDDNNVSEQLFPDRCSVRCTAGPAKGRPKQYPDLGE